LEKEFDKGLLSFQKELKINIEILGAEHSEVAITYQAMADFYRISSKKEEALTHYKLSLKILENRPFPRVAAELQVNTLPLKRRRSLSISFFLKMKCRLTYMRMSD
jgi:tetratricopeptide (TPR) repeat protein